MNIANTRPRKFAEIQVELQNLTIKLKDNVPARERRELLQQMRVLIQEAGEAVNFTE